MTQLARRYKLTEKNFNGRRYKGVTLFAGVQPRDAVGNSRTLEGAERDQLLTLLPEDGVLVQYTYGPKSPIDRRLLKQYQRQVRAINALEPQMEKLDDGALRLKTSEFRNRIDAIIVSDNFLCEFKIWLEE